MTWDVVLRLVNILGCIVCLAMLAHSAFRYHGLWNDKTRLYWWALVGWTFLGLEGTIEVLVRDIDPGPRTIIQTLVLAWMLRALALNQGVNARPSSESQDEDTTKEENEHE